jgi:AP2-associated kinase
MHEIPLAHRDIKIENILYEKGKYKLCDFGSASRERIDFINIDKNDFYKYEEFYEKNTTLMYRPPEMADLFQRY